MPDIGLGVKRALDKILVPPSNSDVVTANRPNMFNPQPRPLRIIKIPQKQAQPTGSANVSPARQQLQGAVNYQSQLNQPPTIIKIPQPHETLSRDIQAHKAQIDTIVKGPEELQEANRKIQENVQKVNQTPVGQALTKVGEVLQTPGVQDVLLPGGGAVLGMVKKAGKVAKAAKIAGEAKKVAKEPLSLYEKGKAVLKDTGLNDSNIDSVLRYVYYIDPKPVIGDKSLIENMIKPRLKSGNISESEIFNRLMRNMAEERGLDPDALFSSMSGLTHFEQKQLIDQIGGLSKTIYKKLDDVIQGKPVPLTAQQGTVKYPATAVKPPEVPQPVLGGKGGKIPLVTDLIEELKTVLVKTDSNDNVIVILPDGTKLAGRESVGVGAFQHLSEGLPPVDQWLDKGVIRVARETSGDIAIELRGQPSLEQVSALKQTIAKSKNVFVDFTSSKGKVVQTLEGTPSQVSRQLDDLMTPQPVVGGKGGKIPPVEPPVATAGAQPNPEFAGNIRLSKYPEEIRNTIKEWADAHPDEIATARRGVRSDAQVLQDAQSLVDDVGGDFAKLQKRWKSGQAWNAEEIMALRGTLRSKTEAVMTAQNAVKQANSTENLVKLKLALDEQFAVQESVSGVTAEAGRALRQFRQEVMSSGNDITKLERLLKQFGGRDKIDEVADLLGKLDLNDPVQVNNFIRNLNKPGAWDWVNFVYINSILSGPKTHVINSLTNTFNTIKNPAERFGTALVEAPLAAIQGRPRARFFSEATADAAGAISGLEDGIRQFGITMRTGINPRSAAKYELGAKQFTGKIGRTVGLPTTLLEASDSFGFAINYQAAFNAEAMRMVKMRGLKGEKFIEALADLKTNPTRELLERAEKVADYHLFRQEAGKFTEWIMRGREVLNIGGFKPLKYIIPFVRTPSNLLKYGLERSFLGWFNPKLLKNLATKNPEAADQIARAGTATITQVTLAWYVMNGNITGAAPTNPAERDRFYRDGKQPYSIRVGDKWVSYQRLEPFNQSLAQVAAMVTAIQDNEKDMGGKVVQAFNTIMSNLVSQTYMTSLSDLIDGISQPERYGGSILSRAGQALLVPASSATRTVTQMIDRTVRQPENFGDVMKSGIPGLSQQVPPKLTALGEEVTRQSPAWSPINITPAQETNLTKELDRLKVNIGFAGTTIGGIKLTPDEKYNYQALSGKLIKGQVSKLIESPGYQKLGDVEKEKAIDSVVTKARGVARDIMARELKEVIALEKKKDVIRNSKYSDDEKKQLLDYIDRKIAELRK